MTYCSLCGIRYENTERVYAGCGSDLEIAAGQEPKDHPLNEEPAVLNRIPIDNYDTTSRFSSQDQESQLGKGLIKPYTIEFGIDGFHFKYDKPLRNFAKQENNKEKVVEFRVTCPEPDAALPEKPEFSAGNEVITELETPRDNVPNRDIAPNTVLEPGISEIETFEERMSGEASETNLENQNTIPEADGVDPVKEPEQAGEIDVSETAETKLPDRELPPVNEMETSPEDTALETGMIPGFAVPEPEIHEDKPVVWEDHERWLGIPLTHHYRISTRSLQIIDRLVRKFSEVDLELISEVKLRRSWLDKILNTGELTVFVKHLPDTGLKLSGIRHPEKVRRLLEERIQ